MGETPTEEEQEINKRFFPDQYIEQSIKMEEANVLYDMINNARPVSANEKIYMAIIEEEVDAYFAGQKGLDEVIDIMKKRIELYLAENKDVS